MKRRVVDYSPRSQEDAAWIYKTVAAAAGPDRALIYLTRLPDFCDRLEYGGERGSRVDRVRQGLRIVGFERRVTVAFIVGDSRVTILRLFYGGRDWMRDFK